MSLEACPQFTKTYLETNFLKQWLAQSQQLLYLLLSKRYNTNALYPAEAEKFSSQSRGAYEENRWAKTMTCSKWNFSTLTYATKLTPMPKVLLQLNRSEEYTENKYTETMTCSKLTVNALGVKQIR